MSNMSDTPALPASVAQLEIVGYRFVPSAQAPAAGVFFAEMLKDGAGNVLPNQESVVLRDQALLAIDQRERESEGWKDLAAQMQRGSDFYRGLIVRCGEAIGPEAYVCDDGSISNSVLALKVPELVEELVKASRYPKNRFLRALRILITGK